MVSLRLFLSSSLLFFISCGISREVDKPLRVTGLFYLGYGDHKSFRVFLDTTGKYRISQYENSQLLFLHKGKYRIDSNEVVLKGFADRKYRRWIYYGDSLVLINRHHLLIANRYHLRLAYYKKMESNRSDVPRFKVKKKGIGWLRRFLLRL